MKRRTIKTKPEPLVIDGEAVEERPQQRGIGFTGLQSESTPFFKQTAAYRRVVCGNKKE